MKSEMRNVLVLSGCLFACAAFGESYYVDSEKGCDAANGQSPATAWKTLERLESLVLQPGDRVLFARGGVWRGKVKLQGGAPGKRTYYGPYGEGPKPLFLGSWARDREEDWTEARPGLWLTQPTNATVFLGSEIGSIFLVLLPS